MALDVQYISLDVSKQPTPQQVRLGQGDANATQLVVSVFDEGVEYDLAGYSVRLSMRLPNDGGYYDVDGTHDGNVATFDVDESYAASTSGVNGFGYVDIMDGETVICSTSRFQLVVLQNASDGVELAPQYSDAVQDAIDRANAAAEAAEGVVLQDVPLMSATVRGGAQLGSGLAIADGKLSVDSAALVLPTMSASTKGAAKLGSGLSVANDALSVDASAIAIGALPVEHGGTGSTSASAARTALGVTPSNIGAAAATHEHAAADITSGALPVTHGGTGADTAAGALSALGAVAKSGDTMTGTLNLMGGIQFASRASYPLYVYSSKPAQSSLPSTPCFVLDTSDGGFYYNDGS